MADLGSDTWMYMFVPISRPYSTHDLSKPQKARFFMCLHLCEPRANDALLDRIPCMISGVLLLVLVLYVIPTRVAYEWFTEEEQVVRLK